MAVTLQDVARLAGVSKSAASRSFTPGASVSAQTRAKVEAAARTLGYSPNVLASSLTTGRTQLIGLVSNNFANPYFLEIFDRFTRALQAAGLRPLLVNLTDAFDAEAAVLMLRQYNVDGVIVASSTLPPDFAAAFRAAGLPVVHAFGWSSATARSDLVAIDNVATGRLAAQTLVARGYRRIAFLGGPSEARTTQDRLAGFRDAAREAGLAVRQSFARAYAFGAGRAEMQALLAQPTRAEAYFCGDDVIAIGALSAARETGLHVPGDIGFLGLNDMEMAGWQNIALTTIRQPLAEIVQTAVGLVRRRIDSPRAPAQTHLLQAALVERSTLRPLPEALRPSPEPNGPPA